MVCDDRGHSYLKQACKECRRLEDGHGDVWLYKNGEAEPRLKFEVKSLSDFWNRHTQREDLNYQLQYVDGIIVIMGEESKLFDEQKLMDVFNGVNDHHRVYQVRDVEHLVRFLKNRERKLNEDKWCQVELRKPVYVEYDSWTEALTNIKNIGPIHATSIRQAFGSFEELLEECKTTKSLLTGDEKADKKVLGFSKICQIPNIGPERARNIIDFVCMRWEKEVKRCK